MKGDGTDDETYSGNVWFHIFSTQGREVKDFIAPKTFEDEDNQQLNCVLFRTGSEFLICYVEQDEDKDILHVYIRQIELGWG